MSEIHKKIARQWIDSINGRNPSALMDVWTPDFVIHAGGGLPEIRDAKTLRQIIGAFWAAVPDLHVTLDDVVAENDRVAIRVTSRGTHTGKFREMAPTGNRIDFVGFGIFRINNGKAAEEWILDDLLTFMRQIGAVSAN